MAWASRAPGRSRGGPKQLRSQPAFSPHPCHGRPPLAKSRLLLPPFLKLLKPAALRAGRNAPLRSIRVPSRLLARGSSAAHPNSETPDPDDLDCLPAAAEPPAPRPATAQQSAAVVSRSGPQPFPLLQTNQRHARPAEWAARSRADGRRPVAHGLLHVPVSGRPLFPNCYNF